MAVLLALVSSLVWGTADFMGGTVARRLPSLVVTGWSQAIGLVAAFVVCIAVGAFGKSDLQAAGPWAAAAGVAGFFALVAFYAALASGTMGVVAPIAAMGVVVPVVAGVLGGDRPAALQVVGLVLAIIGVVLASGPELHGDAGVRPLLLAVVAAVGFGLGLTFLAKGSEASVPLTVFVMRAATVAIVLVLAAAFRSVGQVTPRDIRIFTVIGVADACANLFFGIATTKGLLSLVAVAGSLYPVSTIVLARFVHHERLAPIQYVGAVGAISGVALISVGGA